MLYDAPIDLNEIQVGNTVKQNKMRFDNNENSSSYLTFMSIFGFFILYQFQYPKKIFKAKVNGSPTLVP